MLQKNNVILYTSPVTIELGGFFFLKKKKVKKKTSSLFIIPYHNLNLPHFIRCKVLLDVTTNVESFKFFFLMPDDLTSTRHHSG